MGDGTRIEPGAFGVAALGSAAAEAGAPPPAVPARSPARRSRKMTRRMRCPRNSGEPQVRDLVVVDFGSVLFFLRSSIGLRDRLPSLSLLHSDLEVVPVRRGRGRGLEVDLLSEHQSYEVLREALHVVEAALFDRLGDLLCFFRIPDQVGDACCV